MPQNPAWAEKFAQAVKTIAESFGNQFPEEVDRPKLEAIEEGINRIWLDPAGTWEQWTIATGSYKMFWFKMRRNCGQ